MSNKWYDINQDDVTKGTRSVEQDEIQKNNSMKNKVMY